MNNTDLLLFSKFCAVDVISTKYIERVGVEQNYVSSDEIEFRRSLMLSFELR